MKSRKLMMGFALAAALMIPLAGCAGKARLSASNMCKSAGGTYNMGDNVVATAHSPYHSGYEASRVRPLFQIYYDVLWMKKATGANPLQLELADSIEQVDPTHINVKIKKGTVFHNKAPVNGREVTAEDIAKDIAFMMDPAGHAARSHEARHRLHPA